MAPTPLSFITRGGRGGRGAGGVAYKDRARPPPPPRSPRGGTLQLPSFVYFLWYWPRATTAHPPPISGFNPSFVFLVLAFIILRDSVLQHRRRSGTALARMPQAGIQGIVPIVCVLLGYASACLDMFGRRLPPLRAHVWRCNPGPTVRGCSWPSGLLRPLVALLSCTTLLGIHGGGGPSAPHAPRLHSRARNPPPLPHEGRVLARCGDVHPHPGGSPQHHLAPTGWRLPSGVPTPSSSRTQG